MFDLAIVGAGAAGISAAREARRRGLRTVLLEASTRVGGRVHSIGWEGHALDLGAGWLHSANRNPLVPLAEQKALLIDRAPTPWRGQYQSLGFSRQDQEAAYRSFADFDEEVAKPQPGDIAAAALPSDGRWNAFIQALSGYLNGTSLENMSAADYAAYSQASSECNWRLLSSYGSLIEALSTDLPVKYGFCVREIDWDHMHVRLSSGNDALVSARAIVTVSTNVLASGAIRFVPALDDRLEAASQLPLGHVEKIFFALGGAEEFPNDAHLIGNARSSDTGSYMLRPMGIPVLEGFFGGDWVNSVAIDDLEALARRELSALLGSTFDRRIRRIASSDWKGDLRFGGSYSYACPGQHSARSRLKAPVASRLAFAGEACSEWDFSTVHGAWESGRAAVLSLFGENHDAG